MIYPYNDNKRGIAMFIELTCASIAFSLYSIFVNDNNKEIKDINSKYDKLHKDYSKKLKEVNYQVENNKSWAQNLEQKLITQEEENLLLEKKLESFHERWEIIADSRITSFPQNKQEWDEAKYISKQPVQKVWKAKNLSQTKSSMLTNGFKDSTDDEQNQDFSSLNDDDLDSILAEDESTSSSGSSGSSTTNLSQLKPK